MSATILATGRCRDKHLLALEAEYLKRLKPFLATTIIELPHGKSSGDALKREEAAVQLAKIPENAFVIALDERGKQPGTTQFSTQLDTWRQNGKPLFFIIGGADGLDESVRNRADATIALSALTFPHQMVRVILAEQLYRAMTLINGHPYHRS